MNLKEGDKIVRFSSAGIATDPIGGGEANLDIAHNKVILTVRTKSMIAQL
jgi:hypothetical protein